MKNIILTVFLIASISGNAQINWSNPIDVAISNFGNVRPIVKLINDSIPVVIWSSSQSDEVFFSKWDGTAFSFPIQVNGNADNVMVYNWAGAEIDTYGDDIFITFRTNPWVSGYSYLVKSLDGGATWSDTMHIEPNGFGKKTYFPMPSVLNSNRMTITFMQHDGNDNDPQYARVISTDGGETFSDTLDISRQFGAEACDCCSPLIMANGAKQMISFRNNDNNIREFKALLSEDSGQTFSKEIVVDTSGWVINACPSSTISGVMYDTFCITTYMSANEIYLAKSSLNNGNLNYLGLVSNLSTSKNYPRIAGNQNDMIIIWEQNGNGNDLYYTSFDPSMNSFSADSAKVLIDSAGHQSKPSVVMSADGIIHIVYTDAASGTVKYLNNRAEIVPIDGIVQKPFSTFSIAPNPVSNTIHIPFNYIDYAVVFDESGRTHNVKINNANIDVSLLNSGNYTLVLSRNHEVFSARFIKY